MHFVIVLLASLIASCASIKPEKMVPERTSYGTHFDRTVALSVTGGSPGVGWYSGTLKPVQFEEAIRLSLQRATLFQEFADASVADYLLSVHLKFAGSHPGFNLTAWIHADWSLVERATGSSLWTAEVKGEGRASVGDAFNATARQYIALERAGMANIDSAFSQMGALSPKSQ